MTPRPGSENEADPNGHQPSDQNPSSGSPAGGPAVERIVERFGGIRPMAHKLDIPVTTVQGWKKRGAIPLARHADLRAAAAKHNIVLDEADLEAATPSEDRAAADAADSVTPLPPEAAVVSTPEGVEPARPVDATPPEVEPAIVARPAAAAESAPSETVSEQPRATEPAEPVAAPAHTHEPRREERRSGAGFATFVSLVALLVGAAALSEPWWGPRVPGWPGPSGTTTRTAAPAQAPAAQPDPALRNQIQQIAERVGRLEQRPAGNGNGAAAGGVNPQALENALRQLSGRIDQLDQRVQQAGSGSAEPDPRVNQLAQQLNSVEQQVAAVSGNTQATNELQQRADQLRQEVESLKQQLSSVSQTVETRRDAQTQAQALVLAAGQLRSALANGEPFQQELQAVRSLGVSDPQVTQPLDTLAPFASKGVPTQPQLADRLKAQASDIVRAANQGEGGDWINHVTGRLSTLVTVRRQGGDVVGDSAEAVVARAEAASQEGNLAKAVEELSTLKGPAAEVAAPWIADAKARMAANQAAQQLTQRAIGLMSTAAGGSKGNGQ